MVEYVVKFSKQERLSGEKPIEQLFLKGSSFICYPYRVVWCSQVSDDDTIPLRMLVSVSKKKFKHATDRNFIKRQMREAFRLNKQFYYDLIEIKRLVNVAFIWIPAEKLDFVRVDEKMKEALVRLAATVNTK
jgi:ribonuclease P protein component